jgi:hypothetical protein
MVLFQYEYTHRVMSSTATMEAGQQRWRSIEGAPSVTDQAAHHDPISGSWRQPQCRGRLRGIAVNTALQPLERLTK